MRVTTRTTAPGRCGGSIQDKLEDRLSEGLLGGWIKPGDTVRVELDSEGEIQLVTIPAMPEENSLLAEVMA